MGRTRYVEHFLAGGTILAGGLLLLAFGGARPVLGAKIYVPPGATAASLRAVTVRHEDGLDAIAPGAEVTITRDGAPLASGRSDDHGLVELALAEPLALPATVDVAVDGRRAAVTLARAGELTATPASSTFTREGELTVAVTPERGAIVSPFPAPLRIDVTYEGAPVHAHDFAITVEGGEPEHPQVATHGVGRFTIVATEPVVRLQVRAAERRGRAGTWSGEFRVRIGSCQVREDAGGAVVECPGPQSILYYSVYAQGERLRGGAVHLAPDDRGFHRATLAADTIEGADTIVIASDAGEGGLSTIAWPLGGHAAPQVEPRVGLGGQSLTADVTRERARRLHVRVASSIVLALGLAATLLLALRHLRPPVPAADANDAAAPKPIPTWNTGAGARFRAAALALLLIALGVAVATLLGAR